MKKQSMISIVVPCYNEALVIGAYYKEMLPVIKQLKGKGIRFELIFVDDGSKDKTLEVVKGLEVEFELKGYLQIEVIELSRNFGKEGAMLAGLTVAKGDYIGIMDADLQDPPSMLIDMYKGIVEEGYDCVGVRRVTREGEPKIRSLFARCFYKIINKISETEIVDGARDYRLMTRQMLDSILSLKERNRFSKGLFSWVGYKTKWLEYKNVERVAGETKWSFWKLLIYSIDGITAFSTMPLTSVSVIGIIGFIISLILLIFFFVRRLIFGDAVAGWASLVCIILTVGCFITMCVGVIGLYVAKLYKEVKGRPNYIIKDIYNVVNTDVVIDVTKEGNIINDSSN